MLPYCMNARNQRAKQMMETRGCCSQLDSNSFSVRSQTNPENRYIVSKTDNGLVCQCKDHLVRKSDCKHIKIVLEIIKNNQCYRNNTFRIMERSKLQLCKYCDSGKIRKDGMRQTKKNKVQRFKCLDCKKRFITNFGFEKKQNNDGTITGSLEMYFSGMSVRDISRQYRRMGIKISHMTIYRWVAQYSKLGSEYVDKIVPRVGDWIRADEAFIRVSGKMNYLFSTMDDETRFWLIGEMADTKFQHQADKLLVSTVNMTQKTPRAFITDGLPAYAKSAKRVFGNKTHHVSNVGINSKRKSGKIHPANNKMERLNGEIRDREKVFRGLKKKDTPLIAGLKLWYNFSKEHGGLGGDVTPSEAALIRVDGDNKWKTIIQNASLYKENSI